jgi:TPR repeat protein
MYCNAACKKRHRHKHKKECERRVAELHDENLFKQPPPLEDCPICMIRLPYLHTGRTYMACCGKTICCGCLYAFQFRAFKAGRLKEDNICPFCRTPPASSKEIVKRYKKRLDLNDPQAIFDLGYMYRNGEFELPQNRAKAFELYHRAGELGDAESYYHIGTAYMTGDGVESEEKRALEYYELAAMRGHLKSRYNLGVYEERADNIEEGWSLNIGRALRHYMIAVKDGDVSSLRNIKSLYMHGLTTKDDYAKALRLYQAYLEEIKSDQRDEAVVFDIKYRYYESAV